MAGFIPAANVVRVALRFSVAGNDAFNILHINNGSPATSGNLTTIAGIFQTWWSSTYRFYVSDQCNFIGATLTALDSPGSPFLVYSNSGTLSGDLHFAALPPQVTVAVSFATGLSGRSYRGRAYMIGLCVALGMTGGVLGVGPQTDIRALWENLRSALASAGKPLCIASFYSGIDSDGKKIPRASAVVTNVSAVAVHPRIDTQRRRLPKEL